MNKTVKNDINLTGSESADDEVDNHHHQRLFQDLIVCCLLRCKFCVTQLSTFPWLLIASYHQQIHLTGF